jgi:hypothetical protein
MYHALPRNSTAVSCQLLARAYDFRAPDAIMTSGYCNRRVAGMSPQVVTGATGGIMVMRWQGGLPRQDNWEGEK